MCTICAQLQTFDTQCNLTPDTSYARVIESSDAGASRGANASMSAGDSFVGTIGFNGDVDLIAVTLEAGVSYSATLEGNSLHDPVLEVFDSNGNLVAGNDDSSGTLDSALVYTATTSGTYYIAAQAYGTTDTGSYTLSLSEGSTPMPAEVASLDTMADYLTRGYWADTNQPSGSFDTSGNTITVNLSGLTSAGQQLARWAFDAWETVADINFVERGGSNADIQFIDHQSGAYAAASFLGDNIVSATVNISTNWLSVYGSTLDSYSLSSYIHEIGHALGLGHQGNYNGGGNFSSDAEFANDSRQLSIMSYFDPSENPNVNASGGDLMSAMMVDIIAIQNLYGAPDGNNVTSGNTVWGDNSTMTGYWSYLGDALTGDNISGVYNGGDMMVTIYDRDGIDTLNLSSSTTNDLINMVDGTFSNVGGLIGNVGIARGTLIENVTTGSGDDLVNGGWMTNLIITNAGNDTVNGENGWDRIWTGDGNDLVTGGNGNDRVGSDAGFDTVWAGTGDDTVWAGGWSDTVGGGSGNDLIYGGNGDDLVWGGNGADTLDGGLNNDTLNGGSDADVIWGGQGTDQLNGGWGNDTIEGHEGDDLLNGEQGDDHLLGGAGNDSIFGEVGNDTISGGASDDRIWAGWGNDNVTGGTGADVFVFGRGDGSDVITDFSVGEGDILRLDDALWGGGLSESAILSNFSSASNDRLTLVFEGGEMITMNGVTTIADAIEWF